MIYAAEKALNPPDNYEIAGSLTTVPVLCVAERTAVNQATQALSDAKNAVQQFEVEFQKASASEKQALRAEITAAQKTVAEAQKVLDAANEALHACLMSSPNPIPTRLVERR